MYLEPIFASDDIKKKMPEEKKMFDKVDEFWRESMKFFTKENIIWDAIDNDKIKSDAIA
jgi:dynein heavy chain